MLLKLIKQYFAWRKTCTRWLHQNIYDERLEYYNQYEAYKAINLSLKCKLYETEEKYEKLVRKYENRIQ